MIQNRPFWLRNAHSDWGLERAKFLLKERAELSVDGSETLLSVSEYYGVKPRSVSHSDDAFLSRAESLIGYKVVRKDDLAMNIMLAWRGAHGVSNYDGIVSPAYAVFEIDKDRLQPAFAHHLFRSTVYTSEFRRRSTGIMDSRLRLYPEVFGDIPVLLPSLDEQALIASYLDAETARIDDLIAEKAKLLSALNELRRSTVSFAVSGGSNNLRTKSTGIPQFPHVPAHWDVAALKRFVEVTDCKHVTVPFLDEGLPVASIREVRNGVVDLTESKKTDAESWRFLREGREPHVGDLIFVRNASVGSLGLVVDDEPFAMGQDVCLVSQAPVGRFLWYLLASEPVQSQLESLLEGSTIRRVNVEQIRSFIVCWPPVAEQEAIVRHLDIECGRIESLITHVQREENALVELREATVTDAVLGRIDVHAQTKH
jgi:type I restriction enzyme, S subunit